MSYIVIGDIIDTFGNKGELKIRVTTDFPDERFKCAEELNILSTDGKLQKATIENAWDHKNNIIIKFVGCDSITQAEEYLKLQIVIDEEKIFKLPADTFYIHQIIGLKVYNIAHEYLGDVTDYFPTGSNDVYVVTSKSREILIPAIKQVVKKIDLDKKEMIVELLQEW
ncbi:16S rRNA processing protein RimM [Candidatus Poribacteria bacterium]|nr:16S rRNA processing protein RimM [Candidatus Poribacteria bacterium]